MKKIIDGRSYDTEKAKCLGSVEPAGCNTNDFGYWSESLYRTKSGAYFIHGDGGGNSRYGEWHGNTGGWGEKITPISPGAARQWAEEHLDGDKYEKIFGEAEEAGDDRETLNTMVSVATKNALQREKERTGCSIGSVIDGLMSVNAGIISEALEKLMEETYGYWQKSEFRGDSPESKEAHVRKAEAILTEYIALNGRGCIVNIAGADVEKGKVFSVAEIMGLKF